MTGGQGPAYFFRGNPRNRWLTFPLCALGDLGGKIFSGRSESAQPEIFTRKKQKKTNYEFW